MDFKTYFLASAQEIESKMDQILKDWSREVSQVSTKLDPLADVFVNSSLGGKRLRGTLVRLGYELVNKNLTSDIYTASVAIEIFQTAILAHDDIIDLSPTRRGRPTMYRQLGGDHYGISQTICLGDTGLFLSMKLISESNFPAEDKNHALSMFCQMAINTVYGEMLDVELPHLGGEKEESDVMAIHRLKTAYYTIVYPLSIGASLAGADQGLLKKIEQFGEKLGIAFQVQDDILGVFGDEQTIGKSVTSDIEEGKNTTLITKALEKATAEQKDVLNKYYGTGKITESQLEEVKKVLVDTGALDYSRQLAVQYVDQAKLMIPEITKDAEKAALLTEMADYLVSRNK